jgi:spore germination cell wall hydrolase CwlJ-like protein
VTAAAIAALLAPVCAQAGELYALATAPTPPIATAEGDSSLLPALPQVETADRPLLGTVVSGQTVERASLCLTQAIYYEAGFEPLAGRRAVAQVVINRLRRPGYPKSVCGVVFQGAERATGCQFTFTCDGSLGRSPEPMAWAQAREVAIEALKGSPVDQLRGSTHYHASWMTPYWQASMQETARIGGYIFYRRAGSGEIGAGGFGQYAGFEPDTTLLEAPAYAVARPPRIVRGTVPAARAPRVSSFSVWGLQVATVVPHGGALEIDSPR